MINFLHLRVQKTLTKQKSFRITNVNTLGKAILDSVSTSTLSSSPITSVILIFLTFISLTLIITFLVAQPTPQNKSEIVNGSLVKFLMDETNPTIYVGNTIDLVDRDKSEIIYKTNRTAEELEILMLSSKNELELLNTKTGEVKQLTHTGGHVKDFIENTQGVIIFTTYTDHILEVADKIPQFKYLNSAKLTDGIFIMNLYQAENQPSELFRPARFTTESKSDEDLIIVPEMLKKNLTLLLFKDESNFLFHEDGKIKSYSLIDNSIRTLHDNSSPSFCSYHFSASLKNNYLLFDTWCYEGVDRYVLRFNNSGNLEKVYGNDEFYNFGPNTYRPIDTLGRDVIFYESLQTPFSLSEDTSTSLEILYIGKKGDNEILANLTEKLENPLFYSSIPSTDNGNLYLYGCNSNTSIILKIDKDKNLSETSRFNGSDYCNLLDVQELSKSEFIFLVTSLKTEPSVEKQESELILLSTIDNSKKVIMNVTYDDSNYHINKTKIIAP